MVHAGLECLFIEVFVLLELLFHLLYLSLQFLNLSRRLLTRFRWLRLLTGPHRSQIRRLIYLLLTRFRVGCISATARRPHNGAIVTAALASRALWLMWLLFRGCLCGRKGCHLGRRYLLRHLELLGCYSGHHGRYWMRWRLCIP